MANLEEVQQALEAEMISDMFRRMSTACQVKCIPTNYHDQELNKAEAVCLDRCVAKYLDIHERLGRRFAQVSNQEEQQMQAAAAAQAAAASGT